MIDDVASAAPTLGAPPSWAPRCCTSRGSSEYHEHYYGAFVRDPDGNNVEAVCRTIQPGG
ncbi:MAG: glyoxalase [Nocardioides sp.]|jgi:hypothetical protein|nr:glyoxalase [Nocardioides sp.]